MSDLKDIKSLDLYSETDIIYLYKNIKKYLSKDNKIIQKIKKIMFLDYECGRICLNIIETEIFNELKIQKKDKEMNYVILKSKTIKKNKEKKEDVNPPNSLVLDNFPDLIYPFIYTNYFSVLNLCIFLFKKTKKNNFTNLKEFYKNNKERVVEITLVEAEHVISDSTPCEKKDSESMNFQNKFSSNAVLNKVIKELQPFLNKNKINVESSIKNINKNEEKYNRFNKRSVLLNEIAPTLISLPHTKNTVKLSSYFLSLHFNKEVFLYLLNCIKTSNKNFYLKDDDLYFYKKRVLKVDLPFYLYKNTSARTKSVYFLKNSFKAINLKRIYVGIEEIEKIGNLVEQIKGSGFDKYKIILILYLSNYLFSLNIERLNFSIVPFFFNNFFVLAEALCFKESIKIDLEKSFESQIKEEFFLEEKLEDKIKSLQIKEKDIEDELEMGSLKNERVDFKKEEKKEIFDFLNSEYTEDPNNIMNDYINKEKYKEVLTEIEEYLYLSFIKKTMKEYTKEKEIEVGKIKEDFEKSMVSFSRFVLKNCKHRFLDFVFGNLKDYEKINREIKEEIEKEIKIQISTKSNYKMKKLIINKYTENKEFFEKELKINKENIIEGFKTEKNFYIRNKIEELKEENKIKCI